MLVRLLGSVEVAGSCGWTRAGPAKRSCVLAALAIAPRTPVPLATLTERVWGTDAPSSARSTLYGHIAHLRSTLRECPGLELRRAGLDGYLLDVEPGQVDLHALRDLAAAARGHRLDGDRERAVERWRRAEELMRGEALAGIRGDWAAEIRSGLRREHAAMLAERFTAELELGRHTELVDELSEQVVRHPLSEGLVECLMTALYRGGRPAEALACYAEARGRLAERLGADPGKRLRDLHRRILNQDPALAPPVAAPEPAPPPAAHPLAQLPAAPRLFTGRDTELSELDEALDGPGGPRLCAISGPGGIGKSWLALHWAHRRRGDFPDGQLYVHLHSFDPDVDPPSSETVLRGLLETLGVAASAIPTSLDAMAGLYRGMLAGKRLLLLVDDVRDSSQVVPLLPGDDGCFTIVTGRPGLTTLVASHGARALRLNTLSDDESRAALTRQLGAERLDREPRATGELLSACAGLPLALGILAARAAAEPAVRLAALAESVRDDSARLDALDTGELSAGLRAVLESSLAAVSPEAARLFALLGLLPGSDADRYAIASLAGTPLDRTGAVLRELDFANLLEQHAYGRYRMHDLTRLYARERAGADHAESEHAAALRRLTDHYVHTAGAGRRITQRGLIPRDLGEPAPGCLPRPLADLEAAKQWFAAEHANVVAGQQTAVENGWDASVWRLAWGLSTFHMQHRLAEPGLVVWRRALAAGQRRGDLFGQVVAHHTISQLLIYAGDHDGVQTHAARALELAEESGDVHQLVGAHDAMGKSYFRRGDRRAALRHSTLALDLARKSGNLILQAQSLNSVGWHRAHLGEYRAARGFCEEALAKARAISDDYLAALVLDSLGYIDFHDGRHTDAIERYESALALLRRFGMSEQEPMIMASIADAYEALGRRDEAARLLRDAAELHEAHGNTAEAARLRERAGLRREPAAVPTSDDGVAIERGRDPRFTRAPAAAERSAESVPGTRSALGFGQQFERLALGLVVAFRVGRALHALRQFTGGEARVVHIVGDGLVEVLVGRVRHVQAQVGRVAPALAGPLLEHAQRVAVAAVEVVHVRFDPAGLEHGQHDLLGDAAADRDVVDLVDDGRVVVRWDVALGVQEFGVGLVLLGVGGTGIGHGGRNAQPDAERRQRADGDGDEQTAFLVAV